MSLSDIGSWASIVGLIIAFFVANKVYKISVNVSNLKNNQQSNEDLSIIKVGDTKQENISNQ
ncbi:MAG: hypothetical protein EOL93_08705 [Epsilonproteobacteria bacterium]|nr:hypothetical protein [Campylobacterota bacterium]